MRQRILTAVLVMLGLVGSACTGMPDSGPIVDANVSTQVDRGRPSDISAAPPAAGASANEIVRGFLEAMQASPISLDVARQYLTPPAADRWDPEASTITYANQPTLLDVGLEVSVGLGDAVRLGRSGGWLGPLPADEQELRFDLEVVDGEYRISNPPDALVVPTSWFSNRFDQASLYFFDPSGRILVPEPVFVPRGDQLASTLISRLLLGPGDDLRRVDRSFLPPGLQLAASSVPVDDDGVADVALLGEPGTLTPEVIDRMLAQLAWTLGQDPEIRSLRVTLGDEVLRGPDNEEQYAVEDAVEYDTNGYRASEDLFAVRDHVLVVSEGNELVPVEGALGKARVASDLIRTAAVNLDATRAAGVSSDGRSLLVAPLERPTQGLTVAADTVITGTDLLRPAWDFADRIWVLDRTAEGAVVKVVVGDEIVQIEVPGVSGRQVRSFLVSRDGTRFVAVVRGAKSDELRVGRVAVRDGGGLDRVRSTESVIAGLGPQGRIRDIAWSAPTTLALLLPVDPAPIFEVRSLTVDGSPPVVEALKARLTEAVTGLVGSPVAGLPTYALAGPSRLDLTEGGTYGYVGDAPTSITYVG